MYVYGLYEFVYGIYTYMHELCKVVDGLYSQMYGFYNDMYRPPAQGKPCGSFETLYDQRVLCKQHTRLVT